MAGRVDMDVSYVAKVLAGQRHIPANKIDAFVKLCKLQGKDADMFRVLVDFSRAKRESEARTHFERLLKLQGLDTKLVDPAQYSFYSRWYFTVVRAMLGLRDWKQDWKSMAASIDPELSESQIQASIEALLRLGLIERHGESLRPCDTHISSGAEATSQAIRGFQKEMLSLALRSLDQHPKEQRDMSTITLAMSQSALEDIRVLLADCRQAICRRVAADDEGDAVYQLNMQLFPLSRLIQ